MTRLLHALPGFAIRRPRTVLLLTAVLLLAAAPGMMRLKLRTDGQALIPRNDPAVLADAAVRERFGLLDPVVVLVESGHPAGIYNPATLRRIQELSRALAALESVAPGDVVSLETEMSLAVRPGTFEFRRFLDPLPETPEQIAELRRSVDFLGILRGTLISLDGTATVVLVGVRPDTDRTERCRRIEDLAAGFAAPPDRISIVGAPAAEALLGSHVLDDLARLVPASLAVILLIVWFGCRRVPFLAIAALKVGATLAVTLGLMGWTGTPVTITTIVIPVVVATVGMADEIHVLWNCQRQLARDPGVSAASAVSRTMSAVASPVVLTSFTTAAGLLAFLPAPIVPIREFGVFSAVAMGWCLLFTLATLPALLVLVPAARLRHPRLGPETAGGSGAPPAAAAPALPRWALPVVFVLTAAAGGGLARLEVQDSWIGGFSAGSPFRQATGRTDRLFFGTHLLHFEVRFEPEGRPVPKVRDRSGWYLDPRNLAAVRAFEDYARSLPGVGGVLGPWSQLRANTTISTTFPDQADATLAAGEGILQMVERFEGIRGLRRRREVLDDQLGSGLVTLFLKAANFKDTARILARVRSFEERKLRPLGARLEAAGDIASSQAMIGAIAGSQRSSLAVGLAAVFLLLWWWHRSARAALFIVLTPALVTLWILGGMGWAGIPLGVASSMFGAISLGIGVDYGIHLYAASRRDAAAAAAASGDPGRGSALAEVRPSIVANAVAVGVGFGVLVLSEVPVSARLGALVGLSLLLSCAVAILVAAPMMARAGAPAQRP